MARTLAWNEYKTLFYLTDLVVCVIEGKQIKIVFFKSECERNSPDRQIKNVFIANNTCSGMSCSRC